MPSVLSLVRRDASASDSADDAALTPLMVDLLIALLVLVVIALMAVVALIFMRKARNAKKAKTPELPMYNETERPVSSRMSSHHRSLTIAAAPAYSAGNPSVFVYGDEKVSNEPQTPSSPVPEIRITFPEEVDDKGNKQSGRVVVVRVGEHSVGLEPLHEEQLPPYQKDATDRFQSLDLERIGGLKEKNEYSP
ncbi:uncharacterized protein K452DRAFT_283446 [Aplosporella prunicola CBS 121167]|uniref:Uncharacterized protein n=1 Tax=Aplosporella prunicola CBS 121167 TaxID=1176127 RepID=A0A6A6BSE5_9PEZI|nr:uncharacterized protein K452DRAFT_283446 [Aplosporella prunicola CBS 121167]KAF2146154.1 hypothetical protein K452DRAFT_283446 [Aplosporella prunicola CBS 121167]